MGEAKRKRLADRTVVYLHTSTLQTHFIWMSGVIELEGKSPPVDAAITLLCHGPEEHRLDPPQGPEPEIVERCQHGI
jgi:hypothetical protein